MTKLIYFDICAIFIMLPIIPAMVRKHMNHGTINRWFFTFCGTVIFTAMADVWAVSLDLMGPGNVVSKYIAHTAYLVGRSLVTPVCIAFLFARVGIWFKYKNYYRSIAFFFLLADIPAALLLFVNPFKHIMFYLDDGDIYRRGYMMIIMYVVSLLYAIVGYVVLFRYRSLFDRRKLIYVFCVFSMVLLATGFQFLFPNILIENFALAMATLIVALGIQAPEERLYGNTAFLRTSAFSDDMKMADEMGIEVGLILVGITNYDTLRDMLGYDLMLGCLDNVSKSIEKKRRHIRSDMEFYYLNNGQFIVTLRNSNKDELRRLADYINDSMNSEMSIDLLSVKFNANICIVNYPEDIENAADIISVMENLKKDDYTGEVRLASTHFDKRYYEIRRRIDEVIDRAIVDCNLKLVYQPIYSVSNERYVAAEAFLRLNDPVLGSIEPELLIKEAERCGSIHGITAYLLEEVCKFISGPEFMQLNLSWIELNLSPGQCMWTDLVAVVSGLLEEYGVSPDKICFNIVDNDSDKFSGKMYENMDAFAKMGIHVYMDDFGAGVFEIERIYNLPLEGVKLDREFIRTSMGTDAMLVLENSVRMILDMELGVVAVGIEDLSTRRRLVEMGCDLQQGYYYAAPKEKNEFIQHMVGLSSVTI